MSELTARAMSVLKGNPEVESTGTRKSHTPVFDRMSKITKVAGLSSLVLLGACQTTSMGTKEGFGTVGGAVAGGLLGSRIGGGTGKLIATGVGTLLGAGIGREIGVSLDRADQAYMQRAEQMASQAPVGQRVQWQNPQSGNYGYVQPVRQGVTDQGQLCREYQTTVHIGGRMQQAYGTACQQPNGAWRLLSSNSTAPNNQDFAAVTTAMPGFEVAAAEGPRGPRLG